MHLRGVESISRSLNLFCLQGIVLKNNSVNIFRLFHVKQNQMQFCGVLSTSKQQSRKEESINKHQFSPLILSLLISFIYRRKLKHSISTYMGMLIVFLILIELYSGLIKNKPCLRAYSVLKQVNYARELKVQLKVF